MHTLRLMLVWGLSCAAVGALVLALHTLSHRGGYVLGSERGWAPVMAGIGAVWGFVIGAVVGLLHGLLTRGR